MAFSDVRVVSFDVGGTLVRTDNGAATAQLAALLRVDIAELRAVLNRTAKRRRSSCGELAVDLAATYGGPELESQLIRLLERMRRAAQSPTLFGDVAPTLRALRRRGYVVCFLTNVIGAVSPVQSPDLYRLAHVVFNSCDIGFVKPEREAFATVERALGLDGARILHVGDSLGADVGGARRAGWLALHLDRDSGEPAPGTITSLRELLPLLAPEAVCA